MAVRIACVGSLNQDIAVWVPRPIVEGARFAAAAGALAVQRAGAQPSMPRQTDVEALLRSLR